MRIWNNRHWASDLLGGACVAILSVGLTYWLAPYLQF
jgi:membrane-associated phospholipid phosphatase